jgi:hypothetical protein
MLKKGHKNPAETSLFILFLRVLIPYQVYSERVVIGSACEVK